MVGFWRSLYYYMGWEYHSKNDEFDDRQKHLKYLCCKQIRDTDFDKLLKRKKKEKYPIAINPIMFNILANRRVNVKNMNSQ